MRRLTLALGVAVVAACSPMVPEGEAEGAFDELDAMISKAGGGRCLMVDYNPDGRARAPSAAVQAAYRLGLADLAPNTIEVIYHVIHAANGTGNVSEAILDAQTRVLNADFSGSGFTFVKARVTRTASDAWFVFKVGKTERAAKRALAVDPSRYLNIYVADLQDYMGFAYLPTSFQPDSYLRGVALDYQTLPGGALEHFNEGQTATHEVGHHLGLYHTFDFGCNGHGDYVDDTPPEASPASECPVGRDTCASPGLDPVHNYMDYSWDSCMSEFTAGQAARMQWAVNTYLPSL